MHGVGSWKFRKQLGVGGNGTVWQATRGGGEPVAVKVLNARFLNAKDARYQRFRAECDIHSKLTGRQGILPLLDSHVPLTPSRRDAAWIATKIAEPIKGALRRETLDVVVAAIASIAETLSALHAEGISHRDIKPSNLFRLNGEWVIGDFGLADFPEKGDQTVTGEKIGPAFYIAPEMLNQAKSADGREADVYSIAKTFWVLATGQAYPLPGPQPLGYVNQKIRGILGHGRATTLDLLIARATSQNPKERPTMDEINRELRAWLRAPTSEDGPVPDIGEIAKQIIASSAQIQNVALTRQQQRETVDRARCRLTDGLMAIAKTLKDSGIGGDGVGDMRQIWHLRGLPVSNESQPVYQTAFHTSAVRSINPSEWCKLECVAGMALFDDGQVIVLGGYVLPSRNPRPLPDRLGWSESAPIPVGSALQENAISDLMIHLLEQLPVALQAYSKHVPYP